ncbi:MAG: S1C family serine protease, partial [Raineya sp.]
SSASIGQFSPAPAKNKQEKEKLPKKRIPFEGIAAILLLALAIYGGIVFLQKNDKNKTESALKKEEKPNQQDERDYLKDYDDEGRLIENKELEKDENKQNDNQENSTRPNSGNLEDIVESAENAIFRVDALSGGFSQGFGTGFFVNSSGIGVSNYHVFAPGQNWQIKLKNGQTYEVTRVLKEDADLDYVIFETNAQNVTFLPLAPQIPRKGQDIFVIGNPQGFEFSVTKGIVSGIRNYDRNVGTASEGDDYIQIDAPISSGNSGGPVLNMNGEVVGIATMVVNGRSGVAQNLNLAVNIQKLNMQ